MKCPVDVAREVSGLAAWPGIMLDPRRSSDGTLSGPLTLARVYNTTLAEIYIEGMGAARYEICGQESDWREGEPKEIRDTLEHLRSLLYDPSKAEVTGIIVDLIYRSIQKKKSMHP